MSCTTVYLPEHRRYAWWDQLPTRNRPCQPKQRPATFQTNSQTIPSVQVCKPLWIYRYWIYDNGYMIMLLQYYGRALSSLLMWSLCQDSRLCELGSGREPPNGALPTSCPWSQSHAQGLRLVPWQLSRGLGVSRIVYFPCRRNLPQGEPDRYNPIHIVTLGNGLCLLPATN